MSAVRRSAAECSDGNPLDGSFRRFRRRLTLTRDRRHDFGICVISRQGICPTENKRSNGWRCVVVSRTQSEPEHNRAGDQNACQNRRQGCPLPYHWVRRLYISWTNELTEGIHVPSALLFLNPVEMCPRSQIKCFPTIAAEAINPRPDDSLQLLNTRPGLSTVRLAVLAEKNHNRPSAYTATLNNPAKALLPHRFAGLGIDTTGNAAIVDHID